MYFPCLHSGQGSSSRSGPTPLSSISMNKSLQSHRWTDSKAICTEENEWMYSLMFEFYPSLYAMAEVKWQLHGDAL